MAPVASTDSITVQQAEAECRAFAAEFRTLNVHRAIVLAETGQLSWFAIYDVFRASLAEGLVAVA